MANDDHLEILNQGVQAWNRWRKEQPDIPDLSGADLSRANLSEALLYNTELSEADLRGAILFGVDLSQADLREADLSEGMLCQANLREADLREANLWKADLRQADLNEANLSEANLSEANLSGVHLWRANVWNANLREAGLSGADLSGADLSGADLSGACLESATMVKTVLSDATLNDCWVYGVAAWDLELPVPEKQQNLRITPLHQPEVTIDNLEVAQFVYLLLHNPKIRDVIDTVGQKGVLILGRFTPERKLVLDAIRDRLRDLNLVPMMFDFEKPTQLDFTGTIKTLAGLSRFVIADITNPKSSPLELQAIMPDYMVPFVPITKRARNPLRCFRT